MIFFFMNFNAIQIWMFELYSKMILIKFNNIYYNYIIFQILNQVRYYFYKTPLIIAVENGNKEIVNLLLSHKNIDLNIPSI